MWPIAEMWRRCTDPLRGPYGDSKASNIGPLYNPVDPKIAANSTAGPSPTTLMADSLQVARSQVGVREIPRNSNRGPEVEKYLASVGRGPGEAWCAAFVFWCILQAWKARHDGWTPEEGAPPVPFPRTAWTHEVLLWGAAVPGRLLTPEDVAKGQTVPPGAAFLLYGKVSWGIGLGVRHIGFVEGVDLLGEVSTVEGNTNTAGSREGGGVYRLERSLDSIHRFILY